MGVVLETIASLNQSLAFRNTREQDDNNNNEIHPLSCHFLHAWPQQCSGQPRTRQRCSFPCEHGVKARSCCKEREQFWKKRRRLCIWHMAWMKMAIKIMITMNKMIYNSMYHIFFIKFSLKQ